MQELLEQNARLVGQFPATIKTFNDSLERFNQTVADSTAPSPASRRRPERHRPARASRLRDRPRKALREIPETLEVLRREAVPALRAATETRRRVASLQSDRSTGSSA